VLDGVVLEAVVLEAVVLEVVVPDEVARRSVRKAARTPPLGGTGSIPPAFHGLHRTSRRAVRKPPTNRPWTRKASKPYREHEG